LPVLEDEFIAEVKAFIKLQMSESDYSNLDWDRINVYTKAGKNELVKIPLIGNKRSTDKTVFIKVLGKSLVGNYFQLQGDSITARVITTSFDSKNICIAPILNNTYNGEYKIY